MLTLDSSVLERMSDVELHRFADEELGLFVPPGTPRSVLYTRIVNASMGALDRPAGFVLH